MSQTLTFEEFRKAHRATRCLHHFSPEQRANHASSHLLTRSEQTAIGTTFYVHPMLPGKGFDSAAQAVRAAYQVYTRSLETA